MTARFERLLTLDSALSERLRRNPGSGKRWKLAVFMAHSGDSWFWMAGLGLIWLTSRSDWHDRAAFLAICIVIQALFVFAIKLVFRRTRPPGDWGGIYRHTDPLSFPSGHATRAFLLVALSWGLGPPWFAWIVTLWAPLVSISRVITGVHYFFDVFAGMLLGFIFGLALLQAQPVILAWFPFLF